MEKLARSAPRVRHGLHSRMQYAAKPRSVQVDPGNTVAHVVSLAGFKHSGDSPSPGCAQAYMPVATKEGWHVKPFGHGAGMAASTLPPASGLALAPLSAEIIPASIAGAGAPLCTHCMVTN